MKQFFSALALLAAVTFTASSLVSCSKEKEQDLINGNMKDIEISFAENGEPVLKNAYGINDTEFESNIKGSIAYITNFMAINPDGTCTTYIPYPMLYGISNPQIYFKDKDHLIIFNEVDGKVKQYYPLGVTISYNSGTIFRSEGKYVGQFCTNLGGASFLKAVLYYGEQDGKPVYVKTSVRTRYIAPESYPTGLDEL